MFILILFNIMIQDYHINVILPFLCLYSMQKIKELKPWNLDLLILNINLWAIQFIIPLLFMAIPIPSSIFPGSIENYKRVIMYFFFIDFEKLGKMIEQFKKQRKK
jgi:hypothetical protein